MTCILRGQRRDLRRGAWRHSSRCRSSSNLTPCQIVTPLGPGGLAPCPTKPSRVSAMLQIMMPNLWVQTMVHDV
jgi:hypothetical protein